MGIRVALCFQDLDGKKYIFTTKNLEKHKKKHPELGESTFLNRIKRAVLEPTFIYQDFNNRNGYCYYLEEFNCNGVTRYTKVVVVKNKKEYVIITSYRPTNVKEAKYFKPLCKRP